MGVCDQWKLNKSINPRTNRKIKHTGKVYKELEVECADPNTPKSPRRPPRRVGYSPKCLKWYNNPTVNPTTNRKIKIGGPTYKKLEDECGDPPPGQQPPPPGQQPPPGPVGGRPRPVGGRPGPMGGPSPTQDECDEWKATSKNPRTGRSISPRGKIYQWYQRKCEPSWFAHRLEKGLRVNDSLRGITVGQWDMCMSGNSAPAFRNNFSNLVEIGMGTFGQVYRATLKGDDLVIKEAYLKPDDKRVLKLATAQKQKWDAIEKLSYPQENRILDLVNQLLFSRRCPNFVYVYNMAMCDGCKVQRLAYENPGTGSCYVTFMESADTDLNCINLINFEEQQSVLYQLLIAVYAIHRYYAIWHRDIKTTNVFVKKIKPGGYFEYVIEGNSYFVKNTGVVVYLADFGVSEVLSPLYAFNNYYGFRNAEVMRSPQEIDGSSLYWKPISLGGHYPIEWRDTDNSKVKGTMNKIYPNIKNSVPINLNDSQKFPAFEFFDDIQDVVRLFVGGNQAAQLGSHDRMIALSPQLEDLIKKKQAYVPSRSSIYRTHGTVKYVLAEEMLAQLYIKPRLGVNVDIVDRFVM